LQKSLNSIKENIKLIKVSRRREDDLKRKYFETMYSFYFYQFVSKIDLKIKELTQIHKQFFVKNCYVRFFKKICEIISKKCIIKKKLYDAYEFYLCNLKNKTFNKMKVFFEDIEVLKGKKTRKTLIRKLFFKNMLNIYVYF
jgi:hypothetical protein